ncbi:Stathmin-3 [Frankliniella fusca]|uniref:Stathmin-3 n=1 Tax=Frankliniella fusca TaxID=407009 RepID=A0AAE1H1S9_9NEOP|nr:Stathmin-3 [Frankliniella fusca]
MTQLFVIMGGNMGRNKSELRFDGAETLDVFLLLPEADAGIEGVGVGGGEERGVPDRAGRAVAVPGARPAVRRLDSKSVAVVKAQAAPRRSRGRSPRQHKRVKYSTVEIRAQETSKGGVKYEAILAEPAVQTPPKRNTSPLRAPKSTVPLEEKLKAAEERRLSFEANKIAQLAAQMEKIEIIAKKREEEVSKRKEALDKKIGNAVEKREAHITSVKEKAKEQVEKQAEKAEILAKKSEEEASKKKEALEKKIESALEKREAHINSVKEKVKDHLKKGEETRQNLDKQADEMNQALQESLKKAAEQREDNIKKMLERLQERDRRAELVRQNKERLSSSFSDNQQETASSG